MKNLYQTAIGIDGTNNVVANSVCCSIADTAAAIPTAIRYKRNWQTTAGHGFLLFMRTEYEQKYSGFIVRTMPQMRRPETATPARAMCPAPLYFCAIPGICFSESSCPIQQQTTACTSGTETSCVPAFRSCATTVYTTTSRSKRR